MANWDKWYLPFTQIVEVLAVRTHYSALRIEMALRVQCIMYREYCTVSVQWICFRLNIIGWIGEIRIPFKWRIVDIDTLPWTLQQSIQILKRIECIIQLTHDLTFKVQFVTDKKRANGILVGLSTVSQTVWRIEFITKWINKYNFTRFQLTRRWCS